MASTGGGIDEFNAFRSRMNDVILGAGNLTINRFFALDHRAYEPGALGTKQKEMLGLVASMVLRCDDCITYHVVRCHEEGTTREEFLEIGVALLRTMLPVAKGIRLLGLTLSNLTEGGSAEIGEPLELELPL